LGDNGRVRVLALVVVAGCGFTPGALPAAMGDDSTDDASVIDGESGDTQQVTTDAAVDGMVDAPGVPLPTWVVIDTITVPVIGTMVMSVVTLTNGVSYKLRAEGTFVIQSPLGTPADAEWWDYNNTMQDGVVGVDVGLAVNDFTVDTVRTPKWGAYQASHVYEVDWVGNGQKLVAMLHDGNFANNTGSLTLKVLALQ